MRGACHAWCTSCVECVMYGVCRAWCVSCVVCVMRGVCDAWCVSCVCVLLAFGFVFVCALLGQQCTRMVIIRIVHVWLSSWDSNAHSLPLIVEPTHSGSNTHLWLSLGWYIYDRYWDSKHTRMVINRIVDVWHWDCNTHSIPLIVEPTQSGAKEHHHNYLWGNSTHVLLSSRK